MFFKHLIVVLVTFNLYLIVFGAGKKDNDANSSTPKNEKSSKNSTIEQSYLAAIFDGSQFIGTGIFTSNQDVLCLHNILPEKILRLTVRFGSFGESEYCVIKEIAVLDGMDLMLMRLKEPLKHLKFLDLPTKKTKALLEKGPFTSFVMSTQSTEDPIYSSFVPRISDKTPHSGVYLDVPHETKGVNYLGLPLIVSSTLLGFRRGYESKMLPDRYLVDFNKIDDETTQWIKGQMEKASFNEELLVRTIPIRVDSNSKKTKEAKKKQSTNK